MDLKQQRLSTKLVWIAIAFLGVALAAIGFTLLESWKLEGGAAAINDMGSERMRSYRIAFLLSELERDPAGAARNDLRAEMTRLEDVLRVLKRGDPARPLVLPRDEEIMNAVRAVETRWQSHVRPLIEVVLERGDPGGHQRMRAFRADIEAFVDQIDHVVLALERDNARHIAVLRYMQFGLIALAVAGTVALIYLMFLLVVRPVATLNEGMRRMAAGEFATRLPVETRDEFGELATGFNRMASHLEGLYTTLEERVAAKTRDLAEKNRELAALYEVSRLLNEPASMEDLTRSFLRRLMTLFGARGGAVRLTDAETRKVHLYIHEGLPPELAMESRCIDMGHCLCGQAAQQDTSVVRFMDPGKPSDILCAKAGYETVSIFNIRFKRRSLGVFNLYFADRVTLSAQDRQVLETLGQHLGVAIENQRLVSRDKELAVFEERNLLAQELHDSIAQSLAFLNIQAQLIEDSLRRKAFAEAQDTVGLIREGIQESYNNVRELLVHFRTRIRHEEDLGLALRNLLERFEAQTGIRTAFRESGSGVPLPPESQLQIMHILQEALSNVRKHSGAGTVSLELLRDRAYRFLVRDDGRGFEPASAGDRAQSHIGLRIMRERAQRIGGALAVNSRPGCGTEVVLTVPVTQEHAGPVEVAA